MKATLSTLIRTATLGAMALGLTTAANAGKVEFGERGHAMNPVWSADGSHLAFEVNTFGGDGIDMYFAKIDGSNATRIQKVKLPGSGGPYAGQQVVMNATWHPQGLAVFEGSNSGGQFRLYFAMPNGATASEMLGNSQAKGNLQFPMVAPNGTLLGYISDEYGMGDVMSWDRNSNEITRVTSTGSVSESFPYFSKDGSKMLYIQKGDVATVHQVDLATKNSTRLASGSGDQTRPIYAGDKVLYFSSSPSGEGKWDLALVGNDGSGKKVLAKDVKLPERSRPAVSPDGKYVAFVYADPTKHDSVRVMDIASGAVKEIKTTYTSCGEPALTSKDGRYLLAYTALPSNDSDWRFLFVTDITGDL